MITQQTNVLLLVLNTYKRKHGWFLFCLAREWKKQSKDTLLKSSNWKAMLFTEFLHIWVGQIVNPTTYSSGDTNENTLTLPSLESYDHLKK